MKEQHFNDTKGTCYNFIISGFPGSWLLAGVMITQPDGVPASQADPIWQLTGSESIYLPSRSGLVILFASSKNYPAGEWRVQVSDREGHEAASHFVYP